MPKSFLASSHTFSTAQSGEQPSRHKELHTVAAVFSHKKPSFLWASDCQCWWFNTEFCLALFVYQGSICTEDKDTIQKYLSTGRKWEITSVRAITFLGKTVPTARDLHKLGTLVTWTIRRKGKFLPQLFRVNLKWEKRGKKISHWYSSCCCLSLKNLHVFLYFSFQPTQSNTEASQHICVLHHGQ